MWRAYGRWSVASVDDVVSAFSAYQAALDREEKASWVYADLLARLENALQEGRPDRGRGSRHDVLT